MYPTVVRGRQEGRAVQAATARLRPPQRTPFSPRTRARSRRWAAGTSGWGCSRCASGGRRGGLRRRRSAPTAWICSGGGVLCRQWASLGAERPGGFGPPVARTRWQASRRPAPLALRPPSRTARRCCDASTTSISTRGPARWSTRSRWTCRVVPAGRMSTTTRWTVEDRTGGALSAQPPKRIPRSIPDDWFNELFAALPPPRPGPGRALDLHRSTRVGADRSGSGTSIPASS